LRAAWTTLPIFLAEELPEVYSSEMLLE